MYTHTHTYHSPIPFTGHLQPSEATAGFIGKISHTHSCISRFHISLPQDISNPMKQKQELLVNSLTNDPQNTAEHQQDSVPVITHTHTHTHTHTLSHTHTHAHTHTTLTLPHKHLHTCTLMHTHKHMHTLIHTHSHKQAHAHIQSHTHAHSCTTPFSHIK